MVQICVRCCSFAPRCWDWPVLVLHGGGGGERTRPLSSQAEESGSCGNRLMELKACFDGAIFMLLSLAT